MNRLHPTLIIAFLGLAVPLPAPAQSPFQNRGFESATLPIIPLGQYGDYVPISDGLPGWSGYLGTSPTTQVLQNNLTIGTASISIIGPFWSERGGGLIIEGQFSVVLQAGGISQSSVSIAQVGTIPVTAQSVQMKVNGDLFFGVSYFNASFAGQNIPLIAIGDGPNYKMYAGDIGAFAGQTGELRLTALPEGVFASAVVVDSIQFSPLAVPEPSTYALLGLGGLLLGLGRWRS